MTALFIEEMQKQAELLRELHVHTRNPAKDYLERKPVGSGQSVDYMGHAAVTDALLAHDPLWSWEPLAYDEQGLPLIQRDREGRPRGMWAKLTVHGVTRIGIGTCDTNARDPYKELIGDFIRNAAMRFGVGLNLWSKSEWADEPAPPLNEGPPIPEGSPQNHPPRAQEGGEPTPQARRSGAPEAASTSAATVSPESPPSSPPTSNQEQTKLIASIMRVVREMGLPDGLRRNLIEFVTKGRSRTIKDIDAEEASDLHMLLHVMRRRELPPKLPPKLKEEVDTWIKAL